MEETFHTFYKRDDCFRSLIRDSAAWNPSEANYAQVVETVGMKRSAADMKEDLLDLLHTVAGYLPHAYLTNKIVKNTKGWEDVYNIIYENYGVQVTSESLLDFESQQKKPGETHRQFFERLLQHMHQHLAPAGVKVEQTVNTSADKMSISLMNMCALQWLRKTDQSLIDIVRTEYSTELRDNTQLAELVPRIAINIDSLLRRYNKGTTTTMVTAQDGGHDAVNDASINKTFFNSKGTNGKFSGRGQSYRGGSFRGHPASDGRPRGGAPPQQAGRGSGLFCPGCYYLSQQLGTALHYRHVPNDCPRKAVTVNVLQMEDSEHFDDATDGEDSVTIGKINGFEDSEQTLSKHFQIQKNSNPTPSVVNSNISPPCPVGLRETLKSLS